MPHLMFKQTVKQLDKRQGGYHFLKLDAETVADLPEQNSTKLKCILDDKVSFSCGINQLEDGNFYIIVTGDYLRMIDKELGDVVSFEIFDDPNPISLKVSSAVSA